MLEVVSIGGYLLQGTGVVTLLLSLYYRTYFTNRMPTSLIFSVSGSIILLIYSLLTYQFMMVVLNIITAIMSYNGYRLWSKKPNKATREAIKDTDSEKNLNKYNTVDELFSKQDIKVIKKGLKTPLNKCSDKLDW